MPSFRDEFRWQNFGLEFEKPSAFYTCQWKWPTWIFPTYRLLAALYVTCSILADLFLHWNYMGNLTIAYLTKWAYLSLTLYLCIACVMSLYHLTTVRWGANRSGDIEMDKVEDVNSSLNPPTNNSQTIATDKDSVEKPPKCSIYHETLNGTQEDRKDARMRCQCTGCDESECASSKEIPSSRDSRGHESFIRSYTSKISPSKAEDKLNENVIEAEKLIEKSQQTSQGQPTNSINDTRVMFESSPAEQNKHDVTFKGRPECGAPLRWHMKLFWALFNLIASSALVITVIYFCIFYPYLQGLGYYLQAMDLNLHGINTFIVLLEMIVCAIPIRILHFVYPLLFGCTYAMFSFVYQISYDFEDKRILYPTVLDWRSPGTTIAIIVILSLVVLPIVQMIFYAFYRLRLLIYERLYKTSFF